MPKIRDALAGPWHVDRRQRVIATLALVILALQFAVIIWGRYTGKSWYEMWPTGLSGVAMIMVLASVRRRALQANPESDLT